VPNAETAILHFLTANVNTPNRFFGNAQVHGAPLWESNLKQAAPGTPARSAKARPRFYSLCGEMLQRHPPAAKAHQPQCQRRRGELPQAGGGRILRPRTLQLQGRLLAEGRHLPELVQSYPKEQLQGLALPSPDPQQSGTPQGGHGSSCSLLSIWIPWSPQGARRRRAPWRVNMYLCTLPFSGPWSTHIRAQRWRGAPQSPYRKSAHRALCGRRAPST